MPGPFTPWSVDADIGEANTIELTAMLSLDPGPMREFRPFLILNLDEAHATELLGKLSLALMRLRDNREPDNVVELHPGSSG
ncbi:hypothetical protein [Roseisolibacter sp. H3M3-2]|uniref:hypothetical protein n=1 Tax=Roseisolibacter sp. H3M3-2 TaxID=3031323 RepID=UPI0023DA412A|nr:hypothetical protein [Roseisolibacter sp. H3M3-2]MDF1506313.1 hypothetical protein [Roseisolibacter sp. H3M3-2]